MGLFTRKDKPVLQQSPVSASGQSRAQGEQIIPNLSPFVRSEESRPLASFPGPGPVGNHLVTSIKAAGMTFTISGRCSPQAIHDEFLRLMPVCHESTCHELGIGMIFGNANLNWCVLTDGEISMAIFPGVPDHPTQNPRAREIFDLAFENLRQCGAAFYHSVFTNGEGYAGEISWVEEATFIPLQWLTPWDTGMEGFTPNEASDENRAIVGAIMGTVMPIYETDDSEELKQWIPRITGLCRQITDADPRLITFVRALYDTANRASLADWAKAMSTAPLGDQGWSQLAEALKEAYPGISLVDAA